MSPSSRSLFHYVGGRFFIFFLLLLGRFASTVQALSKFSTHALNLRYDGFVLSDRGRGETELALEWEPHSETKLMRFLFRLAAYSAGLDVDRKARVELCARPSDRSVPTT